VIRPRGTAGRGGDGPDDDLASGPESVGARLRQAREERGLDLLAVHDRLGRPITQLEALEADDMVALPDEALAVSTLRRYATFLGLDEDTLTRDFRTERSGDDRALVTAAVGGVAAGVSAGPDHLRAFTETGEVPQVGGRAYRWDRRPARSRWFPGTTCAGAAARWPVPAGACTRRRR